MLLTNAYVTIFQHRSQTQRGVRLHSVAALPKRVWLWLTTVMVTREWVACHRNHHADSKSARFMHRWFEFDIGWAYIKLLSAFGLAHVEHARRGVSD